MNLIDLLVQHTYRVERVGDKMVATLDADGNYKATCKEDVEKALTDGSNTEDVFVAPRRRWHKILKKRRLRRARGVGKKVKP